MIYKVKAYLALLFFKVMVVYRLGFVNFLRVVFYKLSIVLDAKLLMESEPEKIPDALFRVKRKNNSKI